MTTALAPMEGVTDLAFRQVVIKAGRPDIFYTEFTNVKSLVSPAGRNNTLERLRFLSKEMPIVPQLWGSDPEAFREASHIVRDLGYKEIDVNTGCPDKNVVKTGGGSALIKNPSLVREIVEATKSAGLPVTVKTRLGFGSLSEWQDWLGFLLSLGLPMLTVHLRTKKEMSKVPAHHELIPEVLALCREKAPQTKIMLNGDFASPQHFREIVPDENVGVMIGRGVFANPFCFGSTPDTKENRLELFRYHIDLYDKLGGREFAALKRFFKIYVNSFAGASELREQLMNTRSTSEVREVMSWT